VELRLTNNDRCATVGNRDEKDNIHARLMLAKQGELDATAARMGT
jgi:hypothetical protein